MAKDIFQPVGQGCVNSPVDIMTLQMLLNDVVDLYLEKPGDVRFDTIDGQVTPLLQSAIAKFQSRSTDMQQEGNKLQPGGFTLSRLNAWQKQQPISRDGTLMCPHGGTIKVLTTGKADPRIDTLGVGAAMIVAGCPMVIGAMPAPCLNAKFLGGLYPNLVDTSTPSLCFGAMAPGGPIIVAASGARYV
jgi:hypothetical protein